jgi:integrase
LLRSTSAEPGTFWASWRPRSSPSLPSSTPTAWVEAGLDALRARRADVDLTTAIPGWKAWLVTQVKPDTAEHYVAHVRSLMPEGAPFLRSHLTKGAVAIWLTDRTALVQKRRPSTRHPLRKADPAPRQVTGSTKLKYLAAVRSFIRYLLDLGLLDSDPTAGLARPKAAPPRCVFHELADVVRLVEGSAQPWRALYALAYGAGIEQGALLSLVETDFDTTRKAVRARGTKAHSRDRIAYVAEWAWPFVAGHLASLTPGERVFRGIDRWEVQDHHRARQKALGLPILRFHDSRHHWAVEALRTGVPVELVSRQLGHTDGLMVLRVYGRFIPRDVEWSYWRERLAERQQAKLGGSATAGATVVPQEKSTREAKNPATPTEREACDDSWGGTRAEGRVRRSPRALHEHGWGGTRRATRGPRRTPRRSAEGRLRRSPRALHEHGWGGTRRAARGPRKKPRQSPGHSCDGTRAAGRARPLAGAFHEHSWGGTRTHDPGIMSAVL